MGGFSLVFEDRPVTTLSSGRSQALLAYLLLNRQTAQSRQRIAFHLWPDSTDEQARANLRKELSRLRHSLPHADDYLQVDTKTLQWLPSRNFSLDVIEFETATKAAEQPANPQTLRTQLAQALEHYRGHLLPHWEEDWLQPDRERLRDRYLWALGQLVQVAETQHDYPTALAYAQHRLRADPLNEATYATLMRLHGLNGDRAKALQVYHQCLTMLREELGVDPSGATRKLYEALLMEAEIPDVSPNVDRPLVDRPLAPTLPSISLPAPISRSAPSPLVGREHEWGLIQQWVSTVLPGMPHPTSGDRSLDAQPKVLLLCGEPGIGKTRLLEELRSLAATHHAQVLWGHGFAAEQMRPYGVWIDALRSGAMTATTDIPPELGFLLPEVGKPPHASPDLSHLFDAVVHLLKQWAAQGPLLVFLDDIQWLDDASAALLHYAIRLLRPLPVLFAFSARPQELVDHAAVSQVIQALRREQWLQTLELQVLDREQTAALIRSTQAIPAAALSLSVVNQVFIDSGGNPLFALEIARSRSIAPGESRQGGTDGTWNPNQPAPTVEALIRDRLQQLDSATRAILPWAAALGRNFQPSMLAYVADYPTTQLLAAIAQLEQQAIIRPSTAGETERGYDFAHDIVRQVVYAQLSEPLRQLIHAQIAHKLDQQAPPDQSLASTIAHHAALGGDRALAASAALAAAERCLKLFAYAEAFALAQQGLHHCQGLPPQTRLVLQASLLRVGFLAGVTGDRAMQLEYEVQQVLDEAKRLGVAQAAAIALETLMSLQFDRSNFTDVHQHSLQAAEVSRVASPAIAAQMLAYSGSCLAEIGRDMRRAEALLLEAQTLANRVGLELCDLFSGLGCVARHYGRYPEARSYLQRAWRLTQAQQDHWRECTYLSYLAMLELETGQPQAALAYGEEMQAVAAKMQGEGSEAVIAQALMALAHYQLGDSETDTEITQAIATLQQLDAKRMLAYVLIGLAETDLNREQPALAVDRAQFALENAQIVNHPSEIALAWAVLIQGLFTSGEGQRATEQLTQLQQTLDRAALSLRAQTAIDHVTPDRPPIPLK